MFNGEGLPVKLIHIPNMLQITKEAQNQIVTDITEMATRPITVIDHAFGGRKLRLEDLSLLSPLTNIQVSASSLHIANKQEARSMFHALGAIGTNFYKVVVDLDCIPASMHRIMRRCLPCDKISQHESLSDTHRLFLVNHKKKKNNNGNRR